MVGDTLSTLLMIAWLLPLFGFVVEIFFGYYSKHPRSSKAAAWFAVACIATGFVCSVSAFVVWNNDTGAFGDGGWLHARMDHGDHDGDGQAEGLPQEEGDTDEYHDDAAGEHPEQDGQGHDASPDAHDSHDAANAADAADAGDSTSSAAVASYAGQDHILAVAEDSGGHADHGHDDAAHGGGLGVYSGSFYTLGTFGGITLSMDYYIDSLTLTMFMMVTLIATCIHLFAMGYMSDELTEDYVDHFAHTADGKHVHRPGRFYRFFAFLSLFCFAMLGLVLAGNIFQVFVFWELVGICSFLLIGFYTERKTASNAANKAFIMNRVGDFGFLIGLMVLLTYFGTFRFGDTEVDGEVVEQGLFSMVTRDATGHFIRDEITGEVLLTDTHGHALTEGGENRTIPYVLLVVAGLGVFAGCVGKSAQFPLQTWLPDAMEGPTPVSALVHSATMVAAGVYLTGRFFPMFVQEVLLTIAYTGCITLFVAATIAVVVTDIKKVLAYSTISQLGYMMLGLGVFGWGAGLFHLVTHAFFKSLMFLCSGSVIHGCHHEQEMPKMGGLLRKMPITGITMLVGVLAISGFPLLFGLHFSGFHSKDAIVASALAFVNANPTHFLLFLLPLVTAGITAFYMFRLWFYTFWGKPRDQHLHDHAHESPWIMTIPLLILAPFAWLCAFGGESGHLYVMITGNDPVHVHDGVVAAAAGDLTLPGHEAVDKVHGQAGLLAMIAAFSGTLLAYLLYGVGIVDLDRMKAQLSGIHGFLLNKWHFDELYDALFMKPAHKVAAFCAWFDKAVFDNIVHGFAKAGILISKWDRLFDEKVVDGFVNLLGDTTKSVGNSLKVVQTGRLRQYVMFIVLGVVTLFAFVFTTFPS